MSYPPDGALSDPQGSGAVVAAVAWLQETLLGTVATTIAVIAVAAVGVMMLNGRIDWRRGATTIVGCFILFGAGSIAAGIRAASALVAEPVDAPEPPHYPRVDAVPLLPKPNPPPPSTCDPYAGASVPSS